MYQQKINEELENTDGIKEVQIECNKIKNVIESAKESLGDKKGKKRNEELFDEECRAAIQEKNNMRKIVLQRMTMSSKGTYRGLSRTANKICRERKR